MNIMIDFILATPRRTSSCRKLYKTSVSPTIRLLYYSYTAIQLVVSLPCHTCTDRVINVNKYKITVVTQVDDNAAVLYESVIIQWRILNSQYGVWLGFDILIKHPNL